MTRNTQSAPWWWGLCSGKSPAPALGLVGLHQQWREKGTLANGILPKTLLYPGHGPRTLRVPVSRNSARIPHTRPTAWVRTGDTALEFCIMRSTQQVSLLPPQPTLQAPLVPCVLFGFLRLVNLTDFLSLRSLPTPGSYASISRKLPYNTPPTGTTRVGAAAHPNLRLSFQDTSDGVCGVMERNCSVETICKHFQFIGCGSN